jgi:hypothetical protein
MSAGKKPSLSYVVGWWAAKLNLNWWEVSQNLRVQKAVPSLDYEDYMQGKLDSEKEEAEKQMENLIRMLPSQYSFNV